MLVTENNYYTVYNISKIIVMYSPYAHMDLVWPEITKTHKLVST